MFRNYVMVALRGMLRHRMYAAVNVAGLAVGFAAAILILLFVQFHLSYDRFFRDADRIHQVAVESTGPDGQTGQFAVGALSMADEFPRGRTDVEAAVRMELHRLPVRHGDARSEEEIWFADAGFFQMFDFRLVEGDPATVLADPSGVVLTESTARKYFGEGPAIGRKLTIDHRHDATVTGIMADPPLNTHFDLTVVLPFFSPAIGDRRDFALTGAYPCCRVYFRLAPGAVPVLVERDLASWYRSVAPVFNDRGVDINLAERVRPWLRPLADIHLNPLSFDARGWVGKAELATFTAIAVLILVIAAVNFTNLATARALQRAREVGVRKALGARRVQLIAQFIGEAVLVALFGLLVAVALVELVLPAYSQFLGVELRLPLAEPGMLALLLGMTVAVGAAGGAYPAFVLSGFVPARVLKGQGAGGGGSGLRTALVVFQFSIAIALMVATAIVYGQFRFASTKDVGFERENVVVVWGRMWGDGVEGRRDRLLAMLRADPDIVSATAGSLVPVRMQNLTVPVQFIGADGPRDIPLVYGGIGQGYFQTLGVPVIAGRDLDENRPADTPRFPEPPPTQQSDAPTPEIPGAILLNRTAARQLGFDDPADALGAEIIYGLSRDMGAGQVQAINVRAAVVGVVEDFHDRSVRDPIQPTFYFFNPVWQPDLLIRLREGATRAVLDRIDAAWATAMPDSGPIDRQFLDVELQEIYEREAKTGQLFAAFSGLAIVVACLGLFALAAFTAERRTKEIGLRKVLGAGVPEIVRLLVWQFSRPVLLANIIAWPVAWFAMGRWLEGFAYRIDLTPLPFAAAGGAALVIAWATVALHAVRVAQTKPIAALRYE